MLHSKGSFSFRERRPSAESLLKFRWMPEIPTGAAPVNPQVAGDVYARYALRRACLQFLPAIIASGKQGGTAE